MSPVIDNYHNVQQDIDVDRGQLRKLAEPTVLPNGAHPRPETGSSPATGAHALAALEISPKDYSLASLRDDLSKLRAKGLVEKVPRSRRYRLPREGYSVCLVFLKLFERIYALLTAGLLSPVSADSRLQQQKRSQLDRLHQRVVDDLDKLMDAVGVRGTQGSPAFLRQYSGQ